MATNVPIVIDPTALERILHGTQAKGYKRGQAEKVSNAWKGNIRRITGATDRSIAVEQDGDDYIVSADSARDPETAWPYLEYGTSKMRAQAPGRRAIRRG